MGTVTNISTDKNGRKTVAEPCLEPCPIERGMRLLGGKWKGSILWHLQNGPVRFNDLARQLDGASKKMVSQRLQEMEETGLGEAGGDQRSSHRCYLRNHRLWQNRPRLFGRTQKLGRGQPDLVPMVSLSNTAFRRAGKIMRVGCQTCLPPQNFTVMLSIFCSQHTENPLLPETRTP